MSTLLKAGDLAKLPVVTYGGEDIAQIKDIVYDANGGQVSAFTLAGRSLFSGPLKVGLPWSAVIGLGADALIIESDQVLVPLEQLVAGGAEGEPAVKSGGNVIHSQVLTDEGTSLGVVSDVVIGIGEQGGPADVVGYEIKPAETLGRGQQPLLIPLPDTMSASGEHLMVPAAAAGYLTDDMAAFGAAVDAFRTQIGERS